MKLRSFPLALALLALACGDDGSGAGGGGAGGAGSTSSSTSVTSTSSAGGAGGGGSASGGGGAGGEAGAAGAGGQGGEGGSAFDYYGALSGRCGVIDESELLDEVPQLIHNELDFSGEPAFEVSMLSPGGQAIHAAGNLNQGSLLSEIFAFEVLHRCEGAALLETENTIDYDVDGKKTDLLVEIQGQRVGVSVVRAMSFPEGAPYSISQASTVLEGKLADILVSSANVSANHAWPKQILAVVAQTDMHAAAIAEAWGTLDATLRADTIVAVTVTEGSDGFVYYDQ